MRGTSSLIPEGSYGVTTHLSLVRREGGRDQSGSAGPNGYAGQVFTHHDSFSAPYRDGRSVLIVTGSPSPPSVPEG